MPVVIEMLNKGLVTARDPMLLRPGELQRTNDCFYRPNDQAIWKVPGRTVFNSSAFGSTATTIKGLRGLTFDDFGSNISDDFIVGYHNSATGTYGFFLQPTAGDPPAFSGAPGFTATGVGNGPTLDAVQYDNRWYLFNGNTDGVPNFVVKPGTVTATPILRNHGLNPVQTVPGVVSASGAGWLDSNSGFGDGYYFFLTTEVVNPGSADEVESTFEAAATAFDSTAPSTANGVIQISGTSNGVTVTKPPTVNPSATHWRVYIHGPETTDDWSYAFLTTTYRVAEVPIGTTTVTIGSLLSSTGFALATVTASNTGWANPGNLLNDNGVSANATANGNSIILSTFNFTVSSPIRGFQVIAPFNNNAIPWKLGVELSWDGGTSWTTDGTSAGVYRESFDGANIVQLMNLGGPSDTWGHTWATGDVSNTNFRVRLRGVIDFVGTTTTQPQVFVDYVKVRVAYGNGSFLAKGALFPYVATTVGPITTVVGANGPPPIASTGDIFEGQLVTNDTSDPSIVRYSMPDGPDYFPRVYFINFETKENDYVTHIRALGDKLVVGAQSQVYRVNYLPRAEDAEFDRGRCYEIIAADHGIVGTQAACLFSPPEKNDSSDGQVLAYCSTNGLHATNGFSSTTLTEDLDWANMVNVQQLGKSILLNYPKYYELIFYYIPYGDTTSTYPTRALHLSYHPSHIKEGGKLLVSGPCVVQAASAYSGKYLSKPIHYTGRTNGTIYVEDQGFTDAAGVGINPDIVTRDIYAAGIGYESTHERLWVRHYQHNPPSTVQVDHYWRNTEGEFTHPSAAGTPWTQLSFSTTKGAPLEGSATGLVNAGCLSRLHIAAGLQECMVYRFRQFDGGAGMALSIIGIEGEGHGLEEH